MLTSFSMWWTLSRAAARDPVADQRLPGDSIFFFSFLVALPLPVSRVSLVARLSDTFFSLLPTRTDHGDLAEHPFTYFTCGEVVAEVGHLELIFTSCPYSSFLRKNSWSRAKTNSKGVPRPT